MKKTIFCLSTACLLGLFACNNAAPKPENITTNTDSSKTMIPTPKEEPTYGYKVGDAVEDFKLKNIDGKMWSMADAKDAKGFVVIFTCNHCPYSIAYEDRIIELDKKYKAKGYPVVAINPNDPALEPDDSFENMVKRAKEKGFAFPYLIDEAQTVFPKFGATKTPHCYIVQKADNQLKVAYIGALDDSKEAADVKEKYLERALESLLAGTAPNPNMTKAIGCSVKYDKEKIKL